MPVNLGYTFRRSTYAFIARIINDTPTESPERVRTDSPTPFSGKGKGPQPSKGGKSFSAKPVIDRPTPPPADEEGIETDRPTPSSQKGKGSPFSKSGKSKGSSSKKGKGGTDGDTPTGSPTRNPTPDASTVTDRPTPPPADEDRINTDSPVKASSTKGKGKGGDPLKTKAPSSKGSKGKSTSFKSGKGKSSKGTLTEALDSQERLPGLTGDANADITYDEKGEKEVTKGDTKEDATGETVSALSANITSSNPDGKVLGVTFIALAFAALILA